MTEKNQNFITQQLSEQEQHEFNCDEEFFRQQFSALSCPELPESLSAQNLWSRICAGEGDGQITVDPSTMGVQSAPLEEQETVLESDTDSSVDKPDNVIAFPQKDAGQEPPKGRNLSLAQRRRRWAVACTLVLAVGLSAVFWKYGKSSSGAGALVQNQSTADTAVEEFMVGSAAAEEETAEAAGEETVDEAAVQQEAGEETTAEGETADTTAAQPAEASAEESAVQTQEKEVATEEMQAREDIRQRMLDSLASDVESRSIVTESASENGTAESASVTSEEEQSNPTTGGSEGEEQKPEPNGILMSQPPQEEGEETTEQPVEETVQVEEAVVPQEQSTDAQVQSYSIKGGSLTYDPSSGMVTVLNRSGEQTAAVSLSANAQLLCSDHSFAELVSDEGAATVTLTVYSLEDLSSPEQVSSICHEGTLFDIYQSGTDSYTLMTSVWFTREQIESGDFLPTVDGSEIDVKKINIIEGYGQQEQINYLLTSTLTTDSVKTRADLYLK